MKALMRIYKAIKDINWFKTFRFPKVSSILGPVHMAVTSVNTQNKAHNIVPSDCSFVVDIRVNELYTFEEILSEINKNIQSEYTKKYKVEAFIYYRRSSFGSCRK